jgi:hypothetical protein
MLGHYGHGLATKTSRAIEPVGWLPSLANKVVGWLPSLANKVVGRHQEGLGHFHFLLFSVILFPFCFSCRSDLIMIEYKKKCVNLNLGQIQFGAPCWIIMHIVI